MQQEKILIHIRIQCKTCGGSGGVVPTKVLYYEQRKTELQHEDEKQRHRWKFFMENGYDPEKQREQYCHHCGGVGYTEEWAKVKEITLEDE